jgi:hypothetical protein
MTRNTIELGLFERVLLFCGFVIVTGGVIGLYTWVQSLHEPKGITFVNTPPTTRPEPPKPLPMKPKPLISEATGQVVIEMTPPAEPTTKPVQVVVAPPPVIEAPRPEPTPVLDVKPAAKPLPPGVKPYAIPLISAKVLQSAGDAAEELPYRYHVKLDPAELELFRAMIARAGMHDGLELSQFDHLTAEPAAADLPWWQPEKLSDVMVIALAPQSDSHAKIWTALSNRTGDAMVYSVKPIDFTRHTEARTHD